MNAAALLLALWAPAAALDGSHDAPAPSLAGSAVEKDRQNLLAELWRRRILSPEASDWSPEDHALLERMRRAEAEGALTWVRKRYMSLAGFAVESKSPGGRGVRVWFTREGYERYLRAKTQDAIVFFESKGTDAKWIFRLRDADDRPLFGADGLLTEAGDRVHSQAASGRQVFWKSPAGELVGSRPQRPKR